MKSSFCASCTDERPDLVRRVVDGRRVWLCPACDPENETTCIAPAVDRHRGYQVPDRDYTATIREIAKAAPGGRATGARYSGRAAAPGFVVERVAALRDGHAITRDEARETFRGEPWFAELRHLGTDSRWHIFERPDADAAALARSESSYDPIAALGAASSRGGR